MVYKNAILYRNIKVNNLKSSFFTNKFQVSLQYVEYTVCLHVRDL